MHDLEQTNCNSLDREVYAETVISQIAAICIENPKHDDNYTLQNCLRRLKKSDLVIPVEDVLGRILCVDCDGTKISVRDCIKTLRNKFVCHYDNFDDYDVSGNESTGDGKWTLSEGMALTVSVIVKDGEEAVQCAAEKVKEMFESVSDLGDWANGGRDGARPSQLSVTVEVMEGGTETSSPSHPPTSSPSTMRFKVTPGDGTAPKAFLRVKVK